MPHITDRGFDGRTWTLVDSATLQPIEKGEKRAPIGGGQSPGPVESGKAPHRPGATGHVLFNGLEQHPGVVRARWSCVA